MVRCKMEKSFVIEIPDPSMRQYPNSKPNFISHIPLENLIDVEILVDVDEIQSFNLIKFFPVKQFIEALAIEAMKQSLKMVTDYNRNSNKMVYHFQKDVTV